METGAQISDLTWTPKEAQSARVDLQRAIFESATSIIQNGVVVTSLNSRHIRMLWSLKQVILAHSKVSHFLKVPFMGCE